MPYPISRVPLECPIRLGAPRPRPGDWCFDEDMLNDDGTPHSLDGKPYLSPHYLAHNTWRVPIRLWLPHGSSWIIDSVTTSGGMLGDSGWLVTGDPRLGTLSIAPSVNEVGSYHGFIGSNGVPLNVIGDDLDGRAATHAAKWGIQ